MMKKLISFALAAIMTASSLASCAVQPTLSVTASDDAVSKYTAFLEENLAEMPDELVIGDTTKATEYGVDMTDFEDEGFFTRATNGEVLIFGKTDAGVDRAVRDFVKYGNFDAYSKTYGEGYRVERLTIAGNDISEYAIIYDSDDYNGNIKLAAEQLSLYVEKTCGAVLAYYTDTEFAELEVKPERIITLTVDYPALGNEAFRIEVDDDGNLTIFGGRTEGCVLGVFDLLEDNVGWRFFRDVHDVIKKSKGSMEYLYEAEHIDLTSDINRTEEPLFLSHRMDNSYYAYRYGDKFDTNYDYKKKIRENWYSGHGLYHINWGDAPFDYLRDDQPCLTDEDVLERIDWHVLHHMEIHLEAGYEIGRDIFGLSLGQSDGVVGYCRCSGCMQVVNEEGSAAGLYVRTANRAAQLLKDNGYGEMHVNILAYCETSSPPKKTKPLDNVRVAFCFYVVGDTDVCNAHTINGENCTKSGSRKSSNKVLATRFEGWVDICAPGNLDVWYYPFHAGVAITGAPMVLNLYEDVKYLSEHGVTGIINTIGRTSSQLAALVEYLLDAMTWELPESYEEFLEMIREWLWLNYGDGADALLEYILEYERMGKKADCYTAFYYDTTPLAYVNGGDMIARFDYFCDLFDEALRLANTSDQADRIEFLEAGMLYLGVSYAYNPWYVNGTAEERELLIKRYKRLHKLCTKHELAICQGESEASIGYAPEELNLDENPIMWYISAADISAPDSGLWG